MAKTPAQRWAEKIKAHKDRCRKIMGVSNSIRYAGVINEFGRTLTGTVRPGVKPLLNSEQVKNEFFIISTLMTLRRSPAGAVGALDHIILRHRRVSIVAFQKAKTTYYISLDAKEKNLEKIILGIKKLI